jgi:hypothetical protein
MPKKKNFIFTGGEAKTGMSKAAKKACGRWALCCGSGLRRGKGLQKNEI